MRQMLGTVTVGRDRRITKLRAKRVAMDISWHFLTNVQHTYDREKSWWKNMMSAPPERGAAVAKSITGWLWLDQWRDAENAGFVCPKEQPCDNVPATRPTVKSQRRNPQPKRHNPHLNQRLLRNVIRLLRMALSADNTIAMVFLHSRFFKSWREVLRKCLPYWLPKIASFLRVSVSLSSPGDYADVAYIKHQLLPEYCYGVPHQRFFAFWS